MDEFLKVAAAVKDITRVTILAFLSEHGETCVCELQNSFGMIQSRLSRHLSILRDAGFLKVLRRGTWAYYSIDDALDGFRKRVIEEINGLNLRIPDRALSEGYCGEKKGRKTEIPEVVRPKVGTKRSSRHRH
jgi:ArsR family transcriptional regulator